MLRYVINRLMGLFVTIIVLSVIVFVLMHATPGGPFDLEGGDKGVPLPDAVRQEILKKYELDKPLHIQYLNYMNRAMHFDFGRSFARPSETVAELIGRTWKVSLQLGIATFTIALLLGITMGLIAALHKNSWIDYVTTTLAVGGTVFPNFVIGIILIIIFGVYLRWLPTNGWGGFRYWIMPMIAYAMLPMSQIARYTRSSVLEILEEDFIRTARSKGLRNRIIVMRHILKNALIPVITVGGLLFSDVITGSFFIETIFRIPGLGRYFTSSIMERDYPMIMATALLLGVLFGLVNLISDLLYAVVDPRVRLGDKEVS